MTIKRNADVVLPKRESDKVEFKLPSVHTTKLAAAVCAFLNSNGGRLIVGITDDGEVVGIDDAEGFAATLRTQLQELVTPKALWSVNIDRVGEKDVVAVDVPEGEDRPYVCEGAIYVRRGSHTTSADADTIRKLVETRYTTPLRWERQSGSGLDISDVDADEISKTVEDIRRRERFELPEVVEASNVLHDLALLDGGTLTNGGAVLFARNVCRKLPQARVRATVFSTDKGGDFVDNQVFEGHAFSLLAQLMSFLERNIRISSEFKEGQMERTDKPQYPFAALREGVMNALTHRDYSAFDGGMSIGVFPNRIEIWNSGHLPESLKPSALARPHPSLPPNPDIAHVFYLRGLIERIGRGTVKIVEECRAAKLPAPKWTVDAAGITLTMLGSKDSAFSKLNTRQVELASRLSPGAILVPADYYAEMKEKTKLSQRALQRDLSGLESGGWLNKTGEGPATVYVRTDRAAP